MEKLFPPATISYPIDPSSIGTYFFKLHFSIIWQRNEEALEMMEKAILADRKNPLPMYHKANILSSLKRFDEALENLEELKEFAPHESSVYALMGRIYKRCNMDAKAMLHFGLALDLKPSAADAAVIKVISVLFLSTYYSYAIIMFDIVFFPVCN